MLLEKSNNLGKFLDDNNIEYSENYKLGEKASHKIGGNIKYHVIIDEEDKLKILYKFLNENDIDHFITGLTNNIIISDDGYSSVAISLEGHFCSFEFNDNILKVYSGVPLERIAMEARQYSLSGLEFFSSIPSTVGSAIKLNIQAFGKSISDITKTVKCIVFNENNEVVTMQYNNGDLGTCACSNNNCIIFYAEFELEHTSNQKIDYSSEHYKYIRGTLTPPNSSIGLIFDQRNYTVNTGKEMGIHEMIEKSGSIELVYNDAMWYKRFPNYITIGSNTNANDVYKLVYDTVSRIQKYYQVDVKPIIKFYGDFKME